MYEVMVMLPDTESIANAFGCKDRRAERSNVEMLDSISSCASTYRVDQRPRIIPHSEVGRVKAANVADKRANGGHLRDEEYRVCDHRGEWDLIDRDRRVAKRARAADA